jgi:hypothetical protein
MAALRSAGAHLPRPLAARVTDAAEVAAAIAAVTAAIAAPAGGAVADLQAPTGKRKRQQQGAESVPEAAEPSEQQQQHCKRQKQLQQPVRTPSNSDIEDVLFTGDETASPAAAAAATAETADHTSADHTGSGSAEGLSSEAALRAAREEAELAARAAQQAAGPPTTVEGFKGHPLYVLQRHITKYQV